MVATSSVAVSWAGPASLPWLLLARVCEFKTWSSREESLVGPRAPNCIFMRTFFDEFMVFFLALEFWVVISGTFSASCYVVVGPLVHGRERECVAKTIFVVFVGGGAPACAKGGRATPVKTRVFDSTMGFPGEDVAVQHQYCWTLALTLYFLLYL